MMWTMNMVIGKIALRHLDPLTLAPFRIVAAAILMPIVYALWMRRGEEWGAEPLNRKLNRRDIAWFFVLGAVGVSGNQMLFTIGLNYTTVSHSGLILGAGPIFILLLARLMKQELLSVNKLAGMVLSFAGVTILALEKGFDLHHGTFKGDLITWFGSLAFCLYMVLGKKVAQRYGTFSMNLYTFLMGGLIALPMAIWRGSRLNWGAVAWQGWAAMLYMALFASVIAYLIFYWALRHLAASRLAAFTYLQPILATGVGVLFLGDSVTPSLIMGGSMVMIGVLLAERGPVRHTEPGPG